MFRKIRKKIASSQNNSCHSLVAPSVYVSIAEWAVVKVSSAHPQCSYLFLKSYISQSISTVKKEIAITTMT